MKILSLFCVAALASSSTSSTSSASSASPIKKVLELLVELKQKCVAEGEIEEEQYEKYTKWCAVEADEKQDAISNSKEAVEANTALIEQLDAEIEGLKTDINKFSQITATNQSDLKAAEDVRKKENADFLVADAELSDTIDMIVRAISILSRQVALVQAKGSSPEGFQKVVEALNAVISAASIGGKDTKHLSSLVQSMDNMDDESDDDSKFLARAGPKAAAYESHSKGILDVLDDLKIKAEQEQIDLRKSEVNQRHAYELLAQQLKQEITHEESRIKELQGLAAEKGETRGQSSGVLSEAQTSFKNDTKYLSDLKTMCKIKSEEYSSRQSERQKELKALDEAHEVLSGSTAQSAFNTHLGFIQTKNVDLSSSIAKQQAAAFLARMAKRFNSVGLAQLASRFSSGPDPFSKVKELIQSMIVRLMDEAANEADHFAWCNTETDKSKRNREKHTSRVDQLAARIDKASAGVALLGEEISTLQKEISDMNAGEQEATSQRHDENQSYIKNMAEYSDAQQALQGAIGTLKEYYASTDATAFVQQPDFGGPVFSGEYQKKLDGANGVVGLLEVALSDFARMESEARAEETESVRQFEVLTQNNRVARASKETSIRSKNQEKISLSNNLEELKVDSASSQKELDAVLDYIDRLKESCEVQPMSHEERKQRRENEIQALQEALEILQGESVA